MLVSKQASIDTMGKVSFSKFNNNLKYVIVEYYYREKLSRLLNLHMYFLKRIKYATQQRQLHSLLYHISKGDTMGMIILFVYIIPYMAVSAIVMVITVKYTKKIWIRGIVAAALFLIPTYDIIITNILGAYYCATAPKAFIKETVEYPQSIYFEDNVFNGFNE